MTRTIARAAGAHVLPRLIATLLSGLLALAVLGGGAQARAAEQPIPEGAALWYACTQPEFVGPLTLRCLLPYDPQYLQTFLQGFSRFTPENEFNMVYLEPQDDHFNFTLADQIAHFAELYGKTIRGHTLIWNEENPWWLVHPQLPWTSRALTSVMDTYISTVVGHFATEFPGVVAEWDVVNEPLNWNGTLRWNPWEQAMGPSYIATALEDAHAADPTARLVINELGAEAPGLKSRALLALATKLKESGVPLDAVGFEAHVSPETAPTLDQLLSLWRQYKQVGLDVEVTELDVGNGDGIDDPAAKAAVFERYAEACRLAGNCTGFTVWGVADQYSWLGPDTNALLYNSAFEPTAAAPIVHRLLAGLSSATASDKTDSRQGRGHHRA